MKLFAFCAAVAISAAPVAAATITTLHNTGADDSGVALTGNGRDVHWNVVNPNDMAWTPAPIGNVTYTGVTNGQFPNPPWLADTSVSRWVTPVTDAGNYDHDHAADGVYTYFEHFSLTGFNAATASFTGRFASDNTVDMIQLNGVTIPGSGGSFAAFNAFSSTGGLFLAGDNILAFTVRNYANGAGSNPTGLRVEVVGTADAVPEPTTWALFVGGFGVVGLAARRRVRTVAA